MKVFHGSYIEIAKPDVVHSKRNIDFGPGFYVTTYQAQAEKWAKRKALRLGKDPVVNAYLCDLENENLRILRFQDADEKWLDFVASCRKGQDVGCEYDVIIGQVADDAVFEAVNMYLQGLWDAKRTLEEIRYYKRNDQIVFKTDQAIVSALKFDVSYVPEKV